MDDGLLSVRLCEGTNGMKILVLSQYWAPENGVPQRRWTWLTKLLVEQEHQITVIAPPPHYDRKISFLKWIRNFISNGFNEEEIGEMGERILRSPFLPASNSLTSRAFNQAFVGAGAVFRVLCGTGSLKGYQPDLVIGTVPAIPISVTVWVVAKFYRRPYVVDLRDAWPDLLEQSDNWNAGMGKPSIRQRLLSRGPLQIVSWLTRRIMNHSLCNAEGIIATSERLAQNLRSKSELAKNRENQTIVTIRNVFPVETKVRESKNPATSGACLRVLYAGTIGRAQNLKNAIDAVRLVKEAGIDIQFRIVGSGAEKSELRKHAADLRGVVDFSPVTPAGYLNFYYEWADTALVHLADWEPLERTVPSKVYELLDSGIHISAVVRGETASIVSMLNAGDIVSPGEPESLAKMWIELAQKRERLITTDQGRAWVEAQRETVAPETLAGLMRAVRGDYRL